MVQPHSRHTPQPAQLQLFEPDRNDRWTVRVSRRARRLSVRVYPGGRVEVVTPAGVSAAMVQNFIGKHREWIDERIQGLSSPRGALDELTPQVLELRALGRKYAIEYQEHTHPVRLHQIDDERLLVRGRIDQEHTVAVALRDWVESVAHLEMGRQLRQLAQHTGLDFKRVQIRRQRTRWGSCSASGTISLNMCALFQRPEVLRYLLVHELSHTRHMNHSPHFWALVESIEPHYRELDRELLQGWQYVPSWMFEV